MTNLSRFLMNAGVIGGIVAAGVIVVIIIAVIGWWIAVSNDYRRQTVKIDESASDIDVALTKRYDVLTKQLSIVKGYAKHESETLMKIVAARTGSHNEADPTKLATYNKQLDELASKISLVVEQYPDLKANQNFLALQAAASDTEEHLQAARRIYNNNVSRFNQALVTFPRNIVAKHLHLSVRKFFEAEQVKRQDVKMEF